ncbi:MAG: fructose-6-phosphate aldolase [Bacilli bacterium]|jgi:transaldolase|nr:fructose-6-phosphate aldolase [Bacilli bacterium]MDD4066082.1 fructose-6-phosphate aldolase [Bacilli bacterium]
MKIFIDTANVEEIREVSTWGFIDGVTTNPSLIAKEGRDIVDVIKEITTLIDGPISAEVHEGLAKDMVKEAIPYAKMHKNIVIKLPMTIEGLKACKELTSKGIKTNVTLVFNLTQAVAAAKCGATYVSPFMGRLDDITLGTGAALIEDIATVFATYEYKTQIIAASIRNVEHVNQALLGGADVATIPFKVLKEMLNHPLTTKGLVIFADASKKK